MKESRSDNYRNEMRKRKERGDVYTDDKGDNRMAGFLHPKCYLWVINEAFDGGLKDIPGRLLTQFEGACDAWGWRPHIHHLAQWERVRFDALLRELSQDGIFNREEPEIKDGGGA